MTKLPAKIERITGRDGRALYARRFQPAGEPTATVVVLHGIISHSGWYGTCGDFLTERGCDVWALDRRGSGINADARGDIDKWQTWIDDVIAMCETQRKRGPLVLLGISWGGKLAPAVVRQRPDLFAGFGMLCPGLFARQQPRIGKRIALRITGRLGINERRVKVPLQDPRLFTNSPVWQDYIANDPLTLREVTMRFAREDLKLTRYVRQSAPFIRTPSLLVVAGQDRIARNWRTARYLSSLASPEKTLLEYRNAAHTLEFEPDPQPYFEDLADWIARVTERRKV